MGAYIEPGMNSLSFHWNIWSGSTHSGPDAPGLKLYIKMSTMAASVALSNYAISSSIVMLKTMASGLIYSLSFNNCTRNKVL